MVKGFFRFVRKDVPLVQKDDEAFARLTDALDNAEVLFRNAESRVDHENGKIRTADAFFGAHVAENFDFIFDFRLFAETGSVGHDELFSVDGKGAVNRVAGRARNVGNDNAFFA